MQVLAERDRQLNREIWQEILSVLMNQFWSISPQEESSNPLILNLTHISYSDLSMFEQSKYSSSRYSQAQHSLSMVYLSKVGFHIILQIRRQQTNNMNNITLSSFVFLLSRIEESEGTLLTYNIQYKLMHYSFYKSFYLFSSVTPQCLESGNSLLYRPVNLQE